MPWNIVDIDPVEGLDVTQLLGIQKWEAPIPAQLAGEVRGDFPSFIPKTDQERVQNLVDALDDWNAEGLTFEVTEKLDGASMTVYVYNEDEGVCSRNWNLCETQSNSLWKVCRQQQLIERLRQSDRNLALQGELVGEGIQGNPYEIKGQQFFLYDVYDIDLGTYFTPLERQTFCFEFDINHVPVRGTFNYTLDVQSLLELAEGKSVLNDKTEREGLVFKCELDPHISFKAISNKFLLKDRN